MIIKKVAVGNCEEGFVENNIVNGMNIISSDDNNRGKTIIIQSMMYALGNDPTFPQSFEYKKYYHYIEFEHDSKSYCLCRYDGGFMLKTQGTLILLDNVSELKMYWSKNIFELPVIMKNGYSKIVDPSLFLQLFFVGQDKKDTSNVANHGLYNKSDFIEMLFAFLHISGSELDAEEIASIKGRIQALKDERAIILRQHKILKSKKKSAQYLSSINDRDGFAEKVAAIEKIQDKIAELRKTRASVQTRKSKWQGTIKELNSLNRTMEVGQLRCMDCNSTNISFSTDKKSSHVFDVSSVEMRSQIISSIQQKISAYDEEIERLTVLINLEQERLQEVLKDDDVSLESIVAYKKDIFSAQDAEARIKEIDEEIIELQNKLASNDETTGENRERQIQLLGNIIRKMNEYYKQIDADGNLEFEGLFSKRDETYSGSEATVFHLVKMLALQNELNHSFPIIVDSFRAEDLSTTKEETVIGLFSQLDNQVIFTTTLKREESGKYGELESIHNIDYQSNEPSKILQPGGVAELRELLRKVSIEI